VKWSKIFCRIIFGALDMRHQLTNFSYKFFLNSCTRGSNHTICKNASLPTFLDMINNFSDDKFMISVKLFMNAF
jgi:hypothetical protein